MQTCKCRHEGKRIKMFVGIKLVEKKYWIIGIFYLLSILFVMNDAWLYHTPIAKLTKVETSISGQVRSTRGTDKI